MNDKTLRKEFDRKMLLLEKENFESYESKNSFLFLLILVYFAFLDKNDAVKTHVMKKLLDMIDLEYIFYKGAKFNFDKSQSLEFAKYSVLVDLDVKLIADALNLTVDEVNSIKKEQLGEL